jgi:glucosyl-3-phosphoglycerate synthase
MRSTSAEQWSRDRTFHHSAFPPDRVAAERELSVSVCLPARNEAATIGPILEDLLPLVDRRVIDQVVVVDDSVDGTGDIARALGAEVHTQSALCGELGPVRGKGDAMWRALTVLTGEVVCYLDADSRRFGPHYASALAGLVACPGPVRFAKAFYRRPFEAGDGVATPTGGGRVTGEIAARRDLLETLTFPCGYGVDIALLIDAWSVLGLAGLAQVDLEVRQNRHRPLEELGPMACAVLAAVTERLRIEGRLSEAAAAQPDVEARPPMVRRLAGRPEPAGGAAAP